MSLAGIHYPDTADFFDGAGIIGVTEELAKRGWSVDGIPSTSGYDRQMGSQRC